MRACGWICTLLAVTLLQGCLAARPPVEAESRAPVLAFVDVNVIPMDRERVLEHQTVVVAGARIAAIGPVETVVVPRDAVRVAGAGRFLLPGFTDAHVHLVSQSELALYLANGVTTVFNLHGAPAHLLWRRQVAEGRLPGPAILTTGPTFAQARSPEEARRLVAEQAAAGYDGIKVYNQVSRAEYPALVAEAHRRKLLLIGHVAREPGFDATLAAGQAIAHAEEFTYSFFNPLEDGDDSHIVYDEGRIPEAARRTRAAGVAVVATLSTYRDIVRQATDIEGYLRNPELAWLPPWVRARLEPAMNRYQNRYSEEEIARLRLSLELQRKLVRALDAAGVPLLAGTDATAIGPVAGFAIHEELAELVRSGLTPYRALRTATVNAAAYLGRGDEAGTVERGQRADLVLLEANPLEAIGNTRRIAGVVAAGRWRDAAALRQMRADLPARYAAEAEEALRLLQTDAAQAAQYFEEHDPLSLLAAGALRRLLLAEGGSALRRALERLRASHAGAASEDAVNDLGYQLLAAGRVSDAIAVFQLNCEAYPGSANTYDSLADGYQRAGDHSAAEQSYRRALQVDPAYPNAAAARKFLNGQAPGAAARE